MRVVRSVWRRSARLVRWPASRWARSARRVILGRFLHLAVPYDPAAGSLHNRVIHATNLGPRSHHPRQWEVWIESIDYEGDADGGDYSLLMHVEFPITEAAELTENLRQMVP